MTNNFQVVLGKGGFGVVCHGFLNNEQVAVKVLSQSSTQGYKEFKTEVLNYITIFHEIFEQPYEVMSYTLVYR